MAIRIVFPDPADSPTGRAEIRIRYTLIPGSDAQVRLHYAHGTHTLTREAWTAFAAAGASITAGDAREKLMVRTVLGVDLF